MFRWFDRDAILCTDELATYNWFGGKMRRHMRVTHSAGQYARTEGGVRVHVNTAEGFFGLFKIGIVLRASMARRYLSTAASTLASSTKSGRASLPNLSFGVSRMALLYARAQAAEFLASCEDSIISASHHN